MTDPTLDADTHGRRARSFGAVADEYDRHRPGYPDAAVEWLVPPGARDVADVGAGTGKLTGSLLARGLRVTSIEPDPEMLAVLSRVHPAAETRQAGADSLPLPDASVDAVVVGQAWHWFPHERAAAEIRRVLRPGGRLGLVWNQEAPEEPWQEEIARRNEEARGHAAIGRSQVPDVIDVPGLPSDELEAALVPWTEQVRAEDLTARMATFSHIALLPADRRRRLLDEVAAVMTREASRRGVDRLPFRYTAYCVRWQPEDQ